MQARTFITEQKLQTLITSFQVGLCCENNREPHLLHAEDEGKALQGTQQRHLNTCKCMDIYLCIQVSDYGIVSVT